MKKKNLINHVAFVLDDSGSMGRLRNKMVQVVEQQVKSLSSQSKSSGQETRLSIYTFGERIECMAFDRALSKVESIDDFYRANQPWTKVIDATRRVISDLKEIPTRLGDHAFLIYVETDGLDNASETSAQSLRAVMDDLPEEWTVAVFVPNQAGVHSAKQCGFPAKNIDVWETSERGMDEMADTMSIATQSYMTSRSLGFKGTKSLFAFKDITKKDVVSNLESIPARDYNTLLVRQADDGKAIKDFVEKVTGEAYRVGSAYYQLTKPEKIQPGKVLAVVEHSTGKMYSGVNARKLLGLPSYEVKAAPADHPKFDIFVQSTSTNRKLVGDTQLIVFK